MSIEALESCWPAELIEAESGAVRLLVEAATALDAEGEEACAAGAESN
jgi:hypothetical protein